MLRLLTGTFVVLAGAAPVVHAQQPEVVRGATKSWQVSAYAGIVAWSDEVDGRFRLRYLRDGKLEQPAIAGRSVGFDADLGPDANGAPVIVYSRCRREPAVTLIGDQGDWQTARGCDLYRYSLATRRESKLHHVSSVRSSETTPSIWRGRIAFSSVSEARGGHSRVPTVVVAGLSTGKRSVLRGGSRGRTDANRSATLTSLDLRGTRVAFAWQYFGKTCTPPPDPDDKDPLGGDLRNTEIWSQSTRSAHRLATGCNDAGVINPTFLGDQVAWVQLGRVGGSDSLMLSPTGPSVTTPSRFRSVAYDGRRLIFLETPETAPSSKIVALAFP